MTPSIMGKESYEKLKNNVGILASNIIESCRESANIDNPEEESDWNGYEEFEEIYKFAGEIMSQMNITRVDHTKGIVEVSRRNINNPCDHVGIFLIQKFQCLECGKYLTKQEFQLKISRLIKISKEEIKRRDD